MFYRMDDDVLAARPTPLVEVRPQPGVLRHTVAHFVDLSPFVQILDDLVPVLDFLQKIDAPALVEQVIAVPKISLDRIPQRCPRRRPRRAEQLVEVPTIISYSSLQQRIAEQTIDIPVPHDRSGRGGGGSLQGFSQGQGTTAFSGAEFVDIPVPQGRGGEVVRGGLQGFSQGQGSTAFGGDSSTFQFLRVVVGRLFEEAFKVSRKDRVQQRAVDQIFRHSSSSESWRGGRSSRLTPRPEFSCFILALLCRG